MFRSRPLLLALLIAGPVHAADRPLFDKPGAWVTPVPAPKPEERNPQRGAQVLLLNQQDRLTQDGDDYFNERITRIQTPQGLQEGAVQFDWDPQIDTPVIHKLNIIRGGTTIDVLAGGQGFTILRRENQLEDDMLDGRLTAVLEPEGLRTGDIVDFAFTMRRRDPLFHGHSETLFRSPLWSHAVHLFLRVSWPADRDIRFQATSGLDKPVQATDAFGKSITVDMHDVDPPVPPEGAPPRFRNSGQLQATDLPGWNGVAALLTPLYAQAATLNPDGELAREAARIEAASPDPGTRTLAALKLVQDQIRYVFLAMNGGNYQPAPAELTWQRRFGDCKAKSALLVALLHAMKIDAAPALVSTDAGDELASGLPAIRWFDHVVVRTRIAGKTYWLDGTHTGDRSLDQLTGLPYVHALPLEAPHAALEALSMSADGPPDMTTTVNIDARYGIWAEVPVHVDITLRGESAKWFRQKAQSASYSQVKAGMRNALAEDLDLQALKNLDYDFDDATGEERVKFDAAMTPDIAPGGATSGRYLRLHGTQFPGLPDLSRDAGSSSNDAPFSIAFPDHHELHIAMQLPWRGAGFTVSNGALDRQIAGLQLHRDASLEDGVLHVALSRKALRPEISAAEARDAAPSLAALAHDFLSLHAPADYHYTRLDMAARGKMTLDDPDELLQRGQQRLWRDDYDGAIADMTEVIARRPGDAAAFGARGVALMYKQDAAHARPDIDHAALLDSNEPSMWRGRGMLAHEAGDDTAAAADMTRALQRDPDNEPVLAYRAWCYGKTGRYDQALADWANLIARYPWNDDYVTSRWDVMQAQGRGAAALAEADDRVKAQPKSAELHYGRGLLLYQLGRKPEARAELEHANTITPRAVTYILHARARDDADSAGKLADLGEALKLDDRSVPALKARAAIYMAQKHYEVAIVDYSLALQIKPSDAYARFGRSQALQRLKRTQEAIADLDTIIQQQQPASAGWFNDRCWARATANIQLDTALADCNTALQRAPQDSNALDSRGFVYLRLGQLDRAIEDYNAALQLRPKSPTSLFGRALAEARKGAKDAAGKDLAAARALSPDIDATFADYGVHA